LQALETFKKAMEKALVAKKRFHECFEERPKSLRRTKVPLEHVTHKLRDYIYFNVMAKIKK